MDTQLVTQEDIEQGLKRLGVREGTSLLVHSSLSSLGWVCGGAVAVIYALEQVLGATGTLVLPTHSSDLSEPSRWENPPVPELWWDTIRENMPAFSPDLTPTRGMGQIPETFRKQYDVHRSQHPEVSFVARGPLSNRITEDHALSPGLGETSPLGRLYELNAEILLLGVTHASNTSLHLAEVRANFDGKQMQRCGAPIVESGVRVWKEYEDYAYESEDFLALGKAYEASGALYSQLTIGKALCTLMPMRALVDYAVPWIEQERGSS